MKKVIIFLAIGFCVPVLHGCYYDNIEEIHPDAGLFANCDTTGTISYATDIQPIFNQSCGATNSCHVNDATQSGYGLANWADATSTISNTPFMKSVTHDPSIAASKWMPQNGGMLDKCSIMKIQAWMNRGQLDN